MTKRIAIIGNGTGGSISAALCSLTARENNFELDWYYDPNIKPQAVGEGTTLDIPLVLSKTIGFDWGDLKELDGNYKSGVYKKHWGHFGNEFVHTFQPPAISMHFNANKLQNKILTEVSKNSHVNIFEQNTSVDQIDADYVIDCGGFPKTNDELNVKETIPVNSVHVTQCYWDHPTFDHTLAIAMPFGWVWGIPLQNRCSIGYMYNNNLNSLEEIKEDVKKIFEEYNLEPSDTTNSFSFRSFTRKQNYFDRHCYNGNASFFLEPLEATSIHAMRNVCDLALGKLVGQIDKDFANFTYNNIFAEYESMINLHYLASSQYDTEFWKRSKEIAEKFIHEQLQTSPKFKDHVLKGINQTVDPSTDLGYANWGHFSFIQNIYGLGLQDKLGEML